MKDRRSAGRRFLEVELPVLAILAFALAPYAWMVLTSIKPQAELSLWPVRYLPENATLYGRYFSIYFVGGYFQYRFVFFNAVTHFFKPLQYCPLHDTFSHFGHQHFNECHMSVLLLLRFKRRPDLSAGRALSAPKV